MAHNLPRYGDDGAGFIRNDRTGRTAVIAGGKVVEEPGESEANETAKQEAAESKKKQKKEMYPADRVIGNFK